MSAMHLFGRGKFLRMLWLGFGAGGPDRDGDKENRKTPSPQTSPWLKRQKVSPAVLPVNLTSPQQESEVLQETSSGQNNNQDNKHTQIVKSISEQLHKYRTGRALKTMRALPNFERDFLTFVREQSRLEADNILKQKDPPVSQFTLASLANFQYEKELEKLQKVAPTLMACIGGTISASKDEPLVNLSRKGFGGSRQSEEISLVPTMVQTATCILRNRHPNSISTIPCVNSLNNWTNHVTAQYFFLTNSLGQSFSKKTTANILDRVNQDHDWRITEMKSQIENIHGTETTSRGLKSKASGGVSGFSLFGDNVGKIVNPRFNTGLSNQGSYLQMALTLGVINRVPSAHLSDVPLVSPKDVSYFPSEEELERIRGWMRFRTGQLIAEYHPAFVNCGNFIKHPSVSFPALKRKKSDVSVLSLSVEDPSCHDGMIRVTEKLIPYLPKLPTGSNQKTIIFGDQLYVERGHSVSWGRCGEKDLVSKLDGVIFCPQEWHKRQEDLIVFNQRFNLGHQVDSPGTMQNIKNSFGHNKASKDVGNFYASWDLAQVVTTINLISLVCHKTDLSIDSQDARYSKSIFDNLVNDVLSEIDLLSRWKETNEIDDPQLEDEFSEALDIDDLIDGVGNFHRDMTFFGLLMLAQKSSSQHGDGESAVAMWKNSMADYDAEHKPKYRICCHRKVAACAGVFGAKVQTDALHNCYINDQGLEHTNIEGDLKVEHMNCQFKAGLMQLCGNYSQEALQRVAKSLDVSSSLKEKLTPQYVNSEDPIIKDRFRHRTGDWTDQVVKGVQDLCEADVFEFRAGREMPGAPGYKRKDEVDFKALRRHIKRYNKELSYYIKDTF